MSDVTTLNFEIPGGAVSVAISRLIIAGWAGRDPVALEHHIVELEQLGVKRPSRTPIFYACAASRLTQASKIEALGPASSGEAECVCISHGGELWIGLGSDHTDRELEAIGVAASKQICDKPIGRGLWRLAEIAAHWDRLLLRSYATIDGERVLYQSGPITALRTPLNLVELRDEGKPLPDGTAMFCGTLAAIGGIRPAARFECELEDPVLGRTLTLAYDIDVIPVIS